MIKLNPVPRPKELTDEKVEELTKEFIQTGNAVYKEDYIRNTLLKLSNSKCAYCECRFEESKYCEIEHFHPKKQYPNEVVLWENLLPCCSRCNRKKGKLDTKATPIIHPVKDNPKHHLYYKAYRFYPKTSLGDETIDELDLNNRQQLVNKRFRIGDGLEEQLMNLQKELENYRSDFTRKKQRKITNTLYGIMSLCIPDSEYSATMATILLNSAYYNQLKVYLSKSNIWTQEFEELESKAELCRLDTK